MLLVPFPVRPSRRDSTFITAAGHYMQARHRTVILLTLLTHHSRQTLEQTLGIPGSTGRRNTLGLIPGLLSAQAHLIGAHRLPHPHPEPRAAVFSSGTSLPCFCLDNAISSRPGFT